MGAYFSSVPICNDICSCNSLASSNSKVANNNGKGKIKLLLIGLDNAGKTTTVMHLMGRPIDDVVPTIGFSNLEMKQFNKFPVEIYDLGGGLKIRNIWTNYFALVHGVIYVIDSADESRIPEVRENLEEVLKHDRISKKPILVLVNKQDVEGALEEVDMSKQLNLSFLANTYQCPTRIESTSATSNYDIGSKGGEDKGSNINSSSNITSSNISRRDAGIEAGYSWLVSYILKNWSSLNSRVEQETEEQIKIERQVMNERYRRFRKNAVSPLQEVPQNQEKGAGVTSHSQPETSLTGVHPAQKEEGDKVLTPHTENPPSQENRHHEQQQVLPSQQDIASPSKSTDEDEGVDVRDDEDVDAKQSSKKFQQEVIVTPKNALSQQMTDPSNTLAIIDSSPDGPPDKSKSKRRPWFNSNKITPMNQ